MSWQRATLAQIATTGMARHWHAPGRARPHHGLLDRLFFGPVTSLHRPTPVFSSKAIMATHFSRPVRTRGTPMPAFI